jgi:hypothetical protein
MNPPTASAQPALCQSCRHRACFQARLKATQASDPVLCTLSACGGHLADIVLDLTRLAADRGLAPGHVTLLAIDATPPQRRTALISSVTVSSFTLGASQRGA